MSFLYNSSKLKYILSIASIVRITSVFSTDGRQSKTSENLSCVGWSSARVFIVQLLPSVSAIKMSRIKSVVNIQFFQYPWIVPMFIKNKFIHPNLQRTVDLLGATVSLFFEVARLHDPPSHFPTTMPRSFVAKPFWISYHKINIISSSKIFCLDF